MKFYGNGVVWDPNQNKPLCTFVDGEFETDDAEAIAILKNNGYKNDIVEEVDEGEPTKTNRNTRNNSK